MTVSSHARIALGYAAAASAWILGSDLLLGAWSGGDWLGHALASLKGLAFVAVTAAVLYGLLTRLDRRERDRYRALFDHHPAAMLLIDAEAGRIVDANPAACAFYGWPREQLQRMAIADINQALPEEVRLELGAAREGRAKVFHFRHRLASGEIRDVEVRSGLVPTGDRPMLCSVIFDETERLRVADGLRRYEQLSTAVSELTCAVARMTDPAQIYDTVCRVAVERAGLRFAWVGAVDVGSGRVIPVSRCGDDGGHLDRSGLNLPSGRGLGPCQVAIAEARRFVCNDVAGQAAGDAWGESAARAGIAASATLPILHRGAVVAVLSLCAAEAGFFSDPLVQQFERVTQAISGALDQRDGREHDQRNLTALARAEERWRQALDGGGHAAWEWDVKSGCVFYAEAWKGLVGSAEVAGTLQEWRGRVHPEDLAALDRAQAQLFAGEVSDCRCSYRLRCDDGQYKRISDRCRIAARDADGAALTVVGTHSAIDDGEAATR